MDERCTVLVSSCDAYSDVWTPFFTLLSANWRVPFPVRLITEKKDFFCALPDFKTIKTARGVRQTTWSERLIFALNRIETPYVLLLLEDFFMTAPVDGERIDACINYLEKDKNAVCFSFYPTTGNEPSSKYAGFDKRPQEGLYRFNAQAGLWRTEQLAGFLNPLEDAWQWENEGNKRSFKLKGDFYSISAAEKPIFPYDYMKHGLIGGKWFRETKTLFKEAGIEFDFSKRGFFDEKYKALLPSVASSFIMDDVLYLDKGGFSESDALYSNKGARAGAFALEYRLDGYSGELRWDPSTKTGFAISNLKIEVKDINGKLQAIPIWKLKTNAKLYQKDLVFLEEDPYICFFVGKRGIISVTVMGQLVCPLNKTIIDNTFNKKSLSIGYFITKLLN